MHTRSKKGLIAYHNINDLTIMKKHVDVDHFALTKKLAKEPTITPTKAPCDLQVNKKKAHVFLSTIFKFFH